MEEPPDPGTAAGARDKCGEDDQMVEERFVEVYQPAAGDLEVVFAPNNMLDHAGKLQFNFYTLTLFSRACAPCKSY